MVRNRELFSNHFSHTSARPELAAKTIGLGSMCEEIGNQSPLLFS